MLSLTDRQLGDCRGRCCGPPPDKRAVYLERVAAFDDGDVAEAVQAARNGLAQK
jgi:hypothetical protein